MDNVDLLIDILFDPLASPFERDDAAMDLSQMEDTRVILALEKYAVNPIEEHVLDICGEAIAENWIKQECFHPERLEDFVPKVQRIILSYVREIKPEWLRDNE